VSGFYVCGSTGEAFLLTLEERKEILEIVCDQVHERVSIIAHIGTLSTAFTLELGRHAIMQKGVDAVSAIPPFYYQFSQHEIIEYYFEIAENLNFPVIPYNYPKLSQFTLTPPIIKELRRNRNIIGLKFTSNNFYDLERIKNSDPDITIYNGLDEMYLAGLSTGADGAIGSTFNFMAEKYIGINNSFFAGDIKNARKLQSEANAVLSALLKTQCFMAAEKYMIDLIGIPFGLPRKPFIGLNKSEKDMLSKVAETYLSC
jgi:N-acetylneuraminate lyase